MVPLKEFFIKLNNLWFYKEAPVTDLSNTMLNWTATLVRGFQLGDDLVFAHLNIDKIILLFKDYSLVDYEKTLRDIYFEYKMRGAIEVHEAIKHPHATMEMKALMNVLGEMYKKIEKSVKAQIEKEKHTSAIPSLVKSYIFKN